MGNGSESGLTSGGWSRSLREGGRTGDWSNPSIFRRSEELVFLDERRLVEGTCFTATIPGDAVHSYRGKAGFLADLQFIIEQLVWGEFCQRKRPVTSFNVPSGLNNAVPRG
jgi:hypothetical protein